MSNERRILNQLAIQGINSHTFGNWYRWLVLKPGTVISMLEGIRITIIKSIRCRISIILKALYGNVLASSCLIMLVMYFI
jgi:hypothetical protein